MTHSSGPVRWVAFVALTTSIVGVYCLLAGQALPPLRNEPASLLPLTAISGVTASLFYPVLLQRRSRADRGPWMYVGFVGKTLLVLDAVTGGAAARLYEGLGWVRVGDIPGYALMPRGGLCSTTVFYRNLGD